MRAPKKNNAAGITKLKYRRVYAHHTKLYTVPL